MLRQELKLNSASFADQIRELKNIAADSAPQHELDLQKYASVLTNQLLTPILRNAGRYLKKLTLDHCKLLTEDTPYNIAELCPNLTHLSTQSMTWKKWSTWRIVGDGKFEKLEVLSLAGCLQLEQIWLLAPRLHNHHQLAKEVLDIIYQYYIFHKNPIYFSYYEIAPVLPKLTLTVNCIALDPLKLLQHQLGYRLREDKLTQLIFTRDLPGMTSHYASIFHQHLTHVTSLDKIDMSQKNLTVDKLTPFLEGLMSNKSLQELDLSHNYLSLINESKKNNFLTFLKTHPVLTLLNLNNNILRNEDIAQLSEAIKEHKTLTELNLSNNPFYTLESLQKNIVPNKILKKLHLSGTCSFPGSEINPFLKALKNNTTLEELSIGVFFSNGVLLQFGRLLGKNETLKILHMHCHRFTSDDIRDGWMITKKTMNYFAHSLLSNHTLTSLHFLNSLMDDDSLALMVNAIEKNIVLRDVKVTVDEKMAAKSDYFNHYSKQSKRIDDAMKRNQALIALPSQPDLPVLKDAKAKEIIDVSVSLETLSSAIPVDGSAGLHLQLLSNYCQELQKQNLQLIERTDQVEQKVESLSKRIDFLEHMHQCDSETKKDMSVIESDRRLQEYYNKLCELPFYFKASESIATLLVEQRDNMHDLWVKGASACGKSILHFIPVVSGLACVIEGLETTHHIANNIKKYQRAIHLVNWTKGLGISGSEKLSYSFARKLTLAKKDLLLNPTLSDEGESIWNKLELTIQNFGDKCSQAFREWKENHKYTEQEKMALSDMFKTIDGIANQELIPSLGNEQEKMTKQLDLMLNYILPSFSHPVRHDFSLLAGKSVIALGLWGGNRPVVLTTQAELVKSKDHQVRL